MLLNIYNQKKTKMEEQGLMVVTLIKSYNPLLSSQT